MLDEIRRRLMGTTDANAAIDSVPNDIFARAQAAVVPQDQQTEAADETPDTTSDDTHQPTVAPAPDVPPEVAIANSQTNAQAAGQEPPAAPPVERPEQNQPMMIPPSPNFKPLPPNAQPMAEPTKTTIMPPPGGAPTPPPEPSAEPASAAPNYAQLADTARSARMRDSENINRWNLGEGLKEAFAIARGQHYGGQRYSGPLEEPAVEKEQAAFEARLRNQLAMKRQATEDAIGNRLKESEIGKNDAEAARARLPPAVKPVKPEDFNAQDYKAAMKGSPGIVDAIKRKTGAKSDAEVSKYIDGLPNTKDALELVGGKDLENEAQGKRAEGRGITIGIESAKVGLSKEENVKQAEERTKIRTARKQLDQVQDAFHAVSPADIAKGKVGWDSPEMSGFRSSALALIDKMAQVETGATGRQSQVEQWKKIIEGNSVVTNAQMDAIANGLRGALSAADEENEGRTSGLIKLRPDQPKSTEGAPKKRTITMRFPDGHEEEVEE